MISIKKGLIFNGFEIYLLCPKIISKRKSSILIQDRSFTLFHKALLFPQFVWLSSNQLQLNFQIVFRCVVSQIHNKINPMLFK